MIEVQESVQTMHADNDTLIITDPCYLMRDEHWQHYCDMEFSKYPIGLDNYLRQYLSFGEVSQLIQVMGTGVIKFSQ